MSATKGAYLTRGRGLELEKQIESVRRELGERVAAAEARAAAAEQRVDTLLEVILRSRTQPKAKVA